MKRIRIASLLIPAFAVATLLLSPPLRTVAAAPSPQESEVLSQEAHWLTAIVKGDRKMIESILSTSYKHINSQGKLFNRAQELANVKKEPFTMTPTEQTVDFAGDAAVVHGLNTINQAGKVLARERFTDVFVKQNGSWMAISAQETALY